MIFDSHAHYDDKQFMEDRHELLSSMRANNIDKIVNVGADIETCKTTIELAKQYDFIYAALGVHPSEVSCLNKESFAWLERWVKEERPVAVGEIGLDYYWEKEAEGKAKQKEWFIRQLELAREHHLPVIIHSRDACEDTMDIMKQYAKGLQGVIHCFSYSKEIALEYVKMGYYIGVGGVVTFKNGKKLRETVESVDIENILIETDCPYLTPEPNRGSRNCSLYLSYVVDEIARIKGMTVEEVEKVTYENAMKLYKIEK